MPVSMEIDQSELAGYSFSCLEGCAMCCLCQPELSLAELERFRKAGLTAGLTKRHIQGYSTDMPTALKLQGGKGACHFLRDRRCTEYGLRPAFCRQFPVHIHALHRLQLNANLSCRGITRGGTSLAEFGNRAIGDAEPRAIAEAMADAQYSLSSFRKEAGEAGAWKSPEETRAYGYAVLRTLREPGGIGKLLAWADSGSGAEDPEKVAKAVNASSPPGDLQDIAMLGNMDQLDLEDPAWRPVYVDGKFRWLTYHAVADRIAVEELAEGGATSPVAEIKAEDIMLLEPDAGALAVFGEYSALLNLRDHFLGYACWLCREERHAHDLATVYLGALATTMLDLWWRTCLVGKILGRGKLDGALAREGVRAFDMDCLDMPTIGLFF